MPWRNLRTMSEDFDLDAITLDRANGFVQFDDGELPADDAALVSIIAGELAQLHLYEKLIATSEGEARVLLQLLSRDWSLRFAEPVEAGRALVVQVGGADKEIDARPGPEPLAQLADKIKSLGSTRQMLDFLLELGERIMVCGQLLPWKSESAAVTEHFVTCLEAEELHLEFIDHMAQIAAD